MFPHTAPRGGPQRSLRLQRGHLISQGDFTGDFTGDGHPSSPPGKPVGVAAAQVPSGTLQYLEESILMKSLSGQRAGGIPRGLCEASVPRLLPESQPLALLPTCLPGSTSLPSVCQEGIPLTNTPPPRTMTPDSTQASWPCSTWQELPVGVQSFSHGALRVGVSVPRPHGWILTQHPVLIATESLLPCQPLISPLALSREEN